MNIDHTSISISFSVGRPSSMTLIGDTCTPFELACCNRHRIRFALTKRSYRSWDGHVEPSGVKSLAHATQISRTYGTTGGGRMSARSLRRFLRISCSTTSFVPVFRLSDLTTISDFACFADTFSVSVGSSFFSPAKQASSMLVNVHGCHSARMRP